MKARSWGSQELQSKPADRLVDNLSRRRVLVAGIDSSRGGSSVKTMVVIAGDQIHVRFLPWKG